MSITLDTPSNPQERAGTYALHYERGWLRVAYSEEASLYAGVDTWYEEDEPEAGYIDSRDIEAWRTVHEGGGQ